ncbi:hypothetical protein M501DRAFT_138052 [Patellaria atrata CBS 101060]|uniref:Uncharacterized protein n=1 Tax=Patellaria atrata CBS 101060 TaxID=1346257 RepID=A0A9P4S7X1_9PEZI|nr:hypothetical protein M501DRAFT_138052 [Patellaria atrata CBS 101060]
MRKGLLQNLVLSTGLLSAHTYGYIVDRQTTKQPIPSETEKGISTECKKCPYSLCANKVAYDYEATFNLTCWTEGQSINNDTTWLKTNDGCYVTQWDIVEYPGDFTEDLPYCGRVREQYTRASARTKYKSECQIRPDLSLERPNSFKMYKENVDLTLTCRASDGEEVLGDLVWYKTTANCYVSRTGLQSTRNLDNLEDCGPIPFLEYKMRLPDPEPTTTETSFPTATPEMKRHAMEAVKLSREAIKAHRDWLDRRWLYNTTAGEDYVACRKDMANNSRIVKFYEWAEQIVPQCGTYISNGEHTLENILLLTTDFCYVKDIYTDPGLTESTLRCMSTSNISRGLVVVLTQT